MGHEGWWAIPTGKIRRGIEPRSALSGQIRASPADLHQAAVAAESLAVADLNKSQPFQPPQRFYPAIIHSTLQRRPSGQDFAEFGTGCPQESFFVSRHRSGGRHHPKVRRIVE